MLEELDRLLEDQQKAFEALPFDTMFPAASIAGRFKSLREKLAQMAERSKAPAL